MASIIIPAHNEATVIGRTIASILPQIGEDDQLIVVCNGCSDDTATIARNWSDKITVLESGVPSKTQALNLGDSHAKAYPRIYLDADIRLTDGTLDLLKRALADGPCLAVSPAPMMDFTGSNWFVRGYYDIWLRLPYCLSGMIGAGVYALSEEGRKRFARFPDVIADDGFVRGLFREDERGRVEDAYSIVSAPVSLRWLLKIKVRSRLGQMEMARRFPELRMNEEKAYGRALRNVLAKPWWWPKMIVYLYVVVMSRIIATQQLRDLSHYRWAKDMSSR